MSNEIEKRVESFIKIRDLKKKIKDEYEEKIQKCDEVAERITRELRQLMTEAGAESVKTDKGTVYFSTRYKASAEDWLAVEQFCLENNRLDFFERRLSNSVVKAYAEATGELPPGVRAEIERTVNVRK
jgi:hypothetical protein